MANKKARLDRRALYSRRASDPKGGLHFWVRDSGSEAAHRSMRGAKRAVLDGDALFRFGRLAPHPAAAPDGLGVILALGCIGELLAELADEDVDDLQLRLVHAAIKVVQEHL